MKALAEGSTLFDRKIKKVELLGYGKVKFERTTEGLIVTLPEKKCNTLMPVLKISK